MSDVLNQWPLLFIYSEVRKKCFSFTHTSINMLFQKHCIKEILLHCKHVIIYSILVAVFICQ